MEVACVGEFIVRSVVGLCEFLVHGCPFIHVCMWTTADEAVYVCDCEHSRRMLAHGTPVYNGV